MIERMVVGFAFTADRGSVILIRKERPEWQKGKLNGVGGHIEQGEHPAEAMSREFEEETGVHLPKTRWERVVMMEGSDWHVTFFRALLTNLDRHHIQTMTDEAVVEVQCDIPGGMIPNLTWLLPLCLDQSGIQLPLQVRDVGPLQVRIVGHE